MRGRESFLDFVFHPLFWAIYYVYTLVLQNIISKNAYKPSILFHLM